MTLGEAIIMNKTAIQVRYSIKFRGFGVTLGTARGTAVIPLNPWAATLLGASVGETLGQYDVRGVSFTLTVV